MKIESIKDLEQVIKLARKHNLTSVTVDGIQFQLGVAPYKAQRQARLEDPMANLQVPEPNIQDPLAYAKAEAAKSLKDIQDYIKTDEPTPDQMMMWSSRQEAGTEQ